MARRKEHSHQEIRLMALDAVEQLLTQEEYTSLSLRRIASQVGYAPSTLINLFGSYNYLLLSVSARVLERLLEQMQLVCEQTFATGELKLLALAKAYAEFAHSQPQAFRLVFALHLGPEEPLPESQQQLIAELIGLLEQQLGDLLPNLPSSKLALASRSFWSSIHGLTGLALDDKLFSQASWLQLLTFQVDLWWTAMQLEEGTCS
ncbi:TetR/AcrR family transcriptional regulator [Shewanella carassii]|uniref:TetR family transcriptional regulator n=1 Tax=Shewanella carassii TaxID=1987584 RepID=A0ABQ1TDF8_9GAMM|nr:TetR-like C-terminal domain-containing protein [Shewanella carassii]BCV64811.1 TetR family transcriptional regulator [Shewanella carassii]GGE90314.1 TetR family transcriptional regulator [Shewanella carassii]